MSVQPARGYLGISEVLAQLRAEFPDISVSKIRFLETEGLLMPARSPAGYRRFCTADVERLRYILTTQRDQYLPLRVIKERLASNAEASSSPPPIADSDQQDWRDWPPPSRAATGPLTRRELLEAAGMSEALLTELETFGLVHRLGRHYGVDALEVARAAVALTAYGVEARHLRAVRAAAERETAMIESLVAPMLRQRGPGARQQAASTAGELASLVLRLHGALVAGTLAEAGLAADAQVDVSDEHEATQRPARQIGGASA